MQYRRILILALIASVSGCGLYAKPQPQEAIPIEGRVTFGNRPAAGMWLRFVPLDLPSKQIQTDASGRFSVSIGSTAKLTIEFRALQNLPVGTVDVIGPKAGTFMMIELPDTTVRLSVAGAPGKTPAQIQFYPVFGDGRLSQHPQLAGIVTSENFSSTLNGLRPGKYRVVVDAPGGYVSKAPADIDVKVGAPTSATIEISQTNRMLAVNTDEAHLLQVKVFAGQKTLEGNPAQLTRVSPGTPVVVTSPGFLPKCIVVSDESTTKVKLAREEKSVTKLILGPEKAWPAGALAGPADACFVDAARFSATSTPTSSASAIDIAGLPVSHYSFMPFDGAALVELSPGQKPIKVDMPIGCNGCRSTYPVKLVIR